MYVNLFISGNADIPIGNHTVRITQETGYPWDGKVNIRVVSAAPSRPLALKIRIPGWALNEVSPGSLYTYSNEPPEEPCTLLLNGKEVKGKRKNGYMELSGEWTGNDRIELTLPMKVRFVKAGEQVSADKGLLAIEYGPLVYCAEEADNSRFDEIIVDPQAPCIVERRPDLLNGISVIQANNATFIPYYAWSNRGEGKMKVWFGHK